MVLGPVMSARAEQFILDMIGAGVSEGAPLGLDGHGLVVEGCANDHFTGRPSSPT
jgi:hypothetical protein